METRVGMLELRVENLEKSSEEHEKEDERLHRYMTHMMEDLQARLSGIERTGTRFEADLQHRTGRDTEQSEAIKEIFDRLRTLERMAWIAIGSTVAFSTIATYFGNAIMKVIK